MKGVTSLLALSVAAFFAASSSCAEDYPNRPIRIITAEVGGGTDIMARIIGQGIAGPLGQPVIIENRPSSTHGPLGSKAQPDGYTLIASGSTFILAPLMEKPTHDPIRDFSPVTIATRTPSVLIVNPNVPVKSVPELIAYAKSKAGGLNYASSGTGGSPHITAELFKSMAKVDIVRIDYKGTGPALSDVISGQVQMMIAVPGSVVPNIKSGRVRALAVTSARPSPLFPELPTVAATLPGYEFVAMAGFWVPAHTPGPVVRRLNQEIVRVLSNADAKDKLASLGVEATASSPAEFNTMIKASIANMGKIMKDTGITPQ